MPTIDPMQQEAMRRVQAMQSRINQSRNQRPQSAPNPQRTQGAPNSQRTQNVSNQQEITEENTAETKIPPNIEFKKEVNREMTKPKTESSNFSPVDILLKDKEQNLILLLIVLLAGDGANQNLLLALIYLLI